MVGTVFYPVLLSLAAFVVCTAMELLSVAIADKAAGKTVSAGPGLTGDGQQKAA